MLYVIFTIIHYFSTRRLINSTSYSTILFRHLSSRNKTEVSLNRAVQNLDHYLVVGILERYSDFLAVLECLLPSYFKGVTARYKSE